MLFVTTTPPHGTALSPQKTSKTSVSTFSPQKHGYSNKTLPISMNSAESDGHLLFALTLASPSSAIFSTSSSRPVPFPQQHLSENSDQKTVIFRHDAGSGVYDAFIGSGSAPSTRLVETIVLVSARLDAWTALVLQSFQKKRPRRPTS